MIRVTGCGLRVTGYGLRVTSCALRVAGLSIWDLGFRIEQIERMRYGLRVTGLSNVECGMRNGEF